VAALRTAGRRIEAKVDEGVKIGINPDCSRLACGLSVITAEEYFTAEVTARASVRSTK
jgi:hypothetical protein